MNTPATRSYNGFSLSSICWGYRDLFQRTIERLYKEGHLGKERKEVTGDFFLLLKQADRSCFDHVLKEFLQSLNPSTLWILDVPSLFRQITTTGYDVAQKKLSHGTAYFRILGNGGFGSTPQQAHEVLRHFGRLRNIDADLAIEFLKGANRLLDRLTLPQIGVFVENGVSLYNRNRRQGLTFMSASSASAESVIRAITQECRLDDVRPLLSRMLKALVGREIEIADLSHLDSDEIQERNASVVCAGNELYMPALIRRFGTASENRDWYMLQALATAAMLSRKSFCLVHGSPGYETCRDLVGTSTLATNVFQLVEYYRVLSHAWNHWPGIRRMLRRGAHAEFENIPARNRVDALLAETLTAVTEQDKLCAKHSGRDPSLTVREIHSTAALSANASETSILLDNERLLNFARLCPDMESISLRTVSFLPDFLFPLHRDRRGTQGMAADIRDTAGRNESDKATQLQTSDGQSAAPGGETGDTEGKAPACFLYDEWSHAENDYYEKYCCVYEKTPSGRQHPISDIDTEGESRNVRRLFERLRPDLVRKEKYLQEGDYINPDILVEYLVDKKKEPSPRVRFYERPFVRERDMAVLVLLDVSGSTGNSAGSEKILDVEKRAALVLAEGLDSLGDSFCISGFSGSGREHCEYFIYKDFSEKWTETPTSRLSSAHPGNATRLGAALRHAGYRLSLQPNRTRLLLLITDGKPMDSDYDPSTLHAQYDVRRACEELRRKDVHPFAICTDSESFRDMTIMFPGGTFTTIRNIRQLTSALPKLYVKMTL